MFKKIDRWIGKHMSARRWALAWGCISGVGFGLATEGGWWILPRCIIGLVGVFGIYGNLRRIQ